MNDLIERPERRPPDPLTQVLQNLIEEIALLSGRVELVMRTNARIIAKMDPGFLDDPRDPETKHRSDLLGQSVLEKLKHEALSQAVGDPETFDHLQRYFKGIP